MLASAASLLTACAGSTGFADKPLSIQPQLTRPDAALEADCPGPTTLPEGRMKQATVERLWSKDRAALKQCGEEKATLRDYYITRDRGLSGR